MAPSKPDLNHAHHERTMNERRKKSEGVPAHNAEYSRGSGPQHGRIPGRLLHGRADRLGATAVGQLSSARARARIAKTARP